MSKTNDVMETKHLSTNLILVATIYQVERLAANGNSRGLFRLNTRFD